jgi:predicted AAA+ superfamily ATPase
MDEAFSTLQITSAVNDYVVSNWDRVTAPDVLTLVKKISDAVEDLIDPNKQVQGPNYAIIGARGTGKTWLMKNLNILLTEYFKQHNLKAKSFLF